MDTSNSTVEGNIRAVSELLSQAGVGDPTEKSTRERPVENISEHVLLFHGDLGTWERVQSAQRRRGPEKTPVRRLQFVVFVPGLFHLKMAAATTIWQILLQPLKLEEMARR